MSANPPKRGRQPNFIQPELAALMGGYEEYRRAIESHGEGPRGSQAKERAWENITANLFADSGIVRTPAEFAAAGRQREGGPEDVAPLDDFEARVANTLEPEALFGISGRLDIGAPSTGMNANTTYVRIY
ncbi:hypothetical protein MTO96_041417 [Rhipicephalus appendiculatus]